MLYQQGTQRIEVIVRKEGGGGQVGAKTTRAENVGGGGKGKDSVWSFLAGSDRPERQYRVAMTNLTHTAAVAKQITFQYFTFEMGGIGMRSGDQALQENASRQLEIFKDTTGLASSVVMGAVYGSWGGPIGTIIGAGLGAAATGVSLLFKYADREREFNFKRFKEDNAIEYKRARANINLTTGRLR